MARQHREVLAKLDPLAVARYQITEKDIRTIERYLKIMQAKVVGASLWQEIVEFPSAYATSLVVHELVEFRLLQARGIEPLKLDTVTLQITLANNIDAHIQAILDEHLYLQGYIARRYKQLFQIGTLLKVNRRDVEEKDFQLLLNSDLGVVIVEDERLERAREILAELKGERA
ncbi:MAG: hypothetical protein GWN67_28840 [Phycisphaerae bacterium]|nr:hypothetical protein [Phycisphaerae bacterium]NIW11935.1 hypothetical protein [Gammaproteobacteria bacterium]NIW96534.1 hypothetical protein [Phycisphaerae bacterium]